MRYIGQICVTLLLTILENADSMTLDYNKVYEMKPNRIYVSPDSYASFHAYGDIPRMRVRRRLMQSVRPRIEDRECRLKILLLTVGDLGLGYESEETVRFKYCSGGCPRSRTNHDLTLSRLLQKSEFSASLLEEKIFGGPCCRPTHYEDVVFLDDKHQWHTVEQLSAAACACVG